MNDRTIASTTPFFTISTKGAIAEIQFETCPIVSGMDLHVRGQFMSRFKAITADDRIKVIIFLSPHKHRICENMVLTELTDSYEKRLQIKKLNHSIDNYFKEILESKQITIVANRSIENSLFMNIGIVCDYVIAPEGIKFKNPYYEHTLLPKGGEVFFLRQSMSHKKLLNYFFTDREIEQKEAVEIGLVDEVVKVEDIERMAWQRARQYAQKPSHYIAAVKALSRIAEKGLANCLNMENQIIHRCMCSGSYLANDRKVEKD